MRKMENVREIPCEEIKCEGKKFEGNMRQMWREIPEKGEGKTCEGNVKEKSVREI